MVTILSRGPPESDWVKKRKEGTSRVLIDILQDPDVVGLYSFLTVLVGPGTRSRGNLCPAGSHEIGSYSTLVSLMLGPTRRKRPSNRRHVDLVSVCFVVDGILRKDSEPPGECYLGSEDNRNEGYIFII